MTRSPDLELAKQKLRFDVYGREVLIEREQGHWSAYYLIAAGKRLSAKDIVIPASAAEADMKQHLVHLCH